MSLWRRQWHPTPVLLPGKSHGQRSLVGCNLWGRTESDTTEQLHFHFSLSYIGEGNGTPLQCSCLENPRDRGAWWVYGVAQSRTQLKQLSSNSSSSITLRAKVECGQEKEKSRAWFGGGSQRTNLFINSFIQKIYIELLSYPETGANGSESQQDLRRTEISTTMQVSNPCHLSF